MENKIIIYEHDHTIDIMEKMSTRDMYTEIMNRFDMEEMYAYPLPITGSMSTQGVRVFMMINGWKVTNPDMLTGDELIQ